MHTFEAKTWQPSPLLNPLLHLGAYRVNEFIPFGIVRKTAEITTRDDLFDLFTLAGYRRTF